MIRRAVATLAILPAAALGQMRLDVRFEYVHLRYQDVAEAAIGLRKALGPYVRAEASVGGAFWKSGASYPPARTELGIRFLMDPINQYKRGLSFVGGLGYLGRSYMFLAADLEGQPMGGWRPALRVGVGGGARAALILRRSARDRR